MSKYAYVRVTAPKHDKTLVSFDHAFVCADDIDQAYTKGQKKLPEPIEGYVFLNDYAFSTI